MTNQEGQAAMEPEDKDAQARAEQDPASAAEQQPAPVVPTTFRAVDKLNPGMEPFIFFGF